MPLIHRTDKEAIAKISIYILDAEVIGFDENDTKIKYEIIFKGKKYTDKIDIMEFLHYQKLT